MSRITSYLFISLLLLLLSGCGNSSGNDTPANETESNGSDTSENSTDPEPVPPENTDPAPVDPEPAPPENSDPAPVEPEPSLPESSEPPPADGQACRPSASEQLMLDLVNSARSQSQQCGGQNFAATQALQWSCKLASAADTHSRDMADNNFFSHTGSNGLKVTDRVTAAEYIWRAVGENIAAGQPTEERVMQAWLGSAGHCANIMNPTYKDFGSAVIFSDQTNFSSYWTQVFGTKSARGTQTDGSQNPTEPEPLPPENADPAPADPEPTPPENSDPAPADPQPAPPENSDPAPADPEPTPPENSDPAPAEPEPVPPENSDPAPVEPEPSPPESSEPPPADGQACRPSASEQLMLDLVNSARSQSRQCGGQNFAATQALQWSCKLASAADTHSRDMAENNFFSHTGSNGLKVTDRVTAAEYVWRAVGENIAAGQPTEESVMQAWLGSAGHCANIMNPTYKDFGSALILNDQTTFSRYWTQVFGAQR